MPFKIVRNDITKVKADVIVNTANPNPICASGTDLAIYEAAGKEQLLAERAGIGKIARGDIAVTGSYNLKAKKKTVMALCIALQLNMEQSKDLLARADWAFSPSSKVDLIVQKAITDKQYDIMQLNVTLFKYTNEILGV